MVQVHSGPPFSRIDIHGVLAQLGEHLLCKQGVRSSILLSSTVIAAGITGSFFCFPVYEIYNIGMGEYYGHAFYGSTVLIIDLCQKEASLLQESVRTGPQAVSFSGITLKESPEEIFFRTEETWYSLRFHRFVQNEQGIRFLVHGMKSMYMAEASLEQYVREEKGGLPHPYVLYVRISCRQDLIR